VYTLRLAGAQQRSKRIRREFICSRTRGNVSDGVISQRRREGRLQSAIGSYYEQYNTGYYQQIAPPSLFLFKSVQNQEKRFHT